MFRKLALAAAAVVAFGASWLGPTGEASAGRAISHYHHVHHCGWHGCWQPVRVYRRVHVYRPLVSYRRVYVVPRVYRTIYRPAYWY